jgi:hypothetical protein
LKSVKDGVGRDNEKDSREDFDGSDLEAVKLVALLEEKILVLPLREAFSMFQPSEDL